MLYLSKQVDIVWANRTSRVLAAVAVTFTFPYISFAEASGSKAIYGDDDRVEVVQAPVSLQHAADAVVAIFPKSTLTDPDGSAPGLPDRPTGYDDGWCEDEPFVEQTTTAVCSGFLIAPDRVATSAHCINPPDDSRKSEAACKDLRFVFGYRTDASGRVPDVLRPDQVYRCRAVLAGDRRPRGADWQVIQLDRPTGRTPLALANSSHIAVGAKVDVIGHPSGLPAKVAQNGSIREISSKGFFVVNLDTYEGNSGSPVLMNVNGRMAVLGLLSRGISDFITTGSGTGCLRSRRCEKNDCAGEHATLATYLAPYASFVMDR